ncbi:dynein regulatory complex subunit 2 isoform X1 [Diabrotica undecimpunctata]|uniref:dynein regulatory complex subunit 2 isoform X1 n=2 Tax=Diabrotica undecimpunctata TaxID=50387 RepID=UPI003B641FD7
MGGKKKKSVANKLAKMSDEERARYMQHRAEMEEEAKRRKEQLIATFMKKKVKKEEAFSRLNLAKINQNWHQILRRAKCQEMKDNVEHLRKWIERVVRYKNQTISRLVKELDEAEDDYLTNYTSHSNHIDNILEKQHNYVDKLNNQYQDDLNELLRCADKEQSNILSNADEERMYLQTILYRQELNEKAMKKEADLYMQKYYEDKQELQSKIDKMRQAREEVCSFIWNDIEATVQRYIERTDPRRMHLAELKILDSETAIEVIQNKERIQQEEALKDQLKKELEEVQIAQEQQLTTLNEELDVLQKQFNNIRTALHRDLQLDDKKLKLLVEAASSTKNYMENLLRKGNDILFLVETCKKLETEREKLSKWFSSTSKNAKNVESSSVGQYLEGVDENSEGSSDSVNNQFELGLNKKETKEQERESPESPITTLQHITVQDKPNELDIYPQTSPPEAEPSSSGFIDQCLKQLEPMENFWTGYNRAEVDCAEIMQEKKQLELENKQMRGMIRAILEAQALSTSIPNSKVPTRFPSRRISVSSAPLRRLIF